MEEYTVYERESYFEEVFERFFDPSCPYIDAHPIDGGYQWDFNGTDLKFRWKTEGTKLILVINTPEEVAAVYQFDLETGLVIMHNDKTITDPDCAYRTATSDIWGELFNGGYFTLVNKPVVIDTTEPKCEVLSPEEAARRIVKAIGASIADEDETDENE